MKTTIKLSNKNFSDKFKITFDGKTAELASSDSEAEFEFFNSRIHRLEIQLINQGFTEMISEQTNPVKRFFITVLSVIIALFVSLIDSYDEKDDVKIYSWVKNGIEFDFKKSFIIEDISDNSVITITAHKGHFKNSSKKFSPPYVELKGCRCATEYEHTDVRRSSIKQAFGFYEIPKYVFIFIILAILYAIGIAVFIQSPMEHNLLFIVGMVLVFAVFSFITVMAIRGIYKSYRLYRELSENKNIIIEK